MFFVWEMDLDTLSYKQRIGPGQKFCGHFYFAEKLKKIFYKSLTLAEIKV